MITREEAAVLLAGALGGAWSHERHGSMRTVVTDFHDSGDEDDDGGGWGIAELLSIPQEDGTVRLLAAAPELARTVVAKYDEIATLNGKIARLKRTIACYDAAINELTDRDLVVHIANRLVEWENGTPEHETPRAPERRWVPQAELDAARLELQIVAPLGTLVLLDADGEVTLTQGGGG